MVIGPGAPHPHFKHKHAHTHEWVSRKMIRVMAKEMYTTVSDSRGEEFAVSAGWLAEDVHLLN